jgi:hypothetical protein
MKIRCARQLGLPALLVVSACMCMHPGTATGQSRNAASISGTRTVGSQSGFGTSTFRNYSYGLSGTAGSAPGSGAVTAGGAANTSIRRGGVAGEPTGAAKATSASTPAGSRYLYKANKINIRTGSKSGPGAAQQFSDLVASRVRLGQTLRGAFGLTESPLLTDEPITSFAPNNPYQYATYIRSGEADMKIRQYTQAAEQFRRANYIGSRRPETLLSLAHADFAQGNYASMAYYLRLAIEHFPELAGKNIQLRQFFRDPSEFVALRDTLAAETKRWPGDANLWMASAYVYWFDGNTARASEAIRQVALTSMNPRLTDAANVLWDSCVETGKVAGSLEDGRLAARQPIPTPGPDKPSAPSLAEVP